jgi:hypothetical protein
MVRVTQESHRSKTPESGSKRRKTSTPKRGERHEAQEQPTSIYFKQ